MARHNGSDATVGYEAELSEMAVQSWPIERQKTMDYHHDEKRHRNA